MCGVQSPQFGGALGRYRSACVIYGNNANLQKSEQVLERRRSERLLNSNMCEWLSYGEWCDVKLLCGGRSFNAHRAVLASVSTFLRRILLSCPADETPTFIVLPDFDLEAMSSVLYYIYNGEVILQKHKLRLFLDIIQAMQIYIDCQYLPKLKEAVEEGSFDLNSCYDANTSITNIFTLGLTDDKDQRLFNLRRGTEIQNVLLQYSQGGTDFSDSIVRCKNESELRKSRLGNLKSPYEDRQRNSFLRDLFLETYPRNGNVNGLTDGVLAISNECYRPPASVLSTNANGKHLRSDNALARFCTKTNQKSLNLSKVFNSGQQLQCTKKNIGKYELHARNNANPSCIKFPTDSSDMTFVYGNSETAAEFLNDRIPLLPHEINDRNALSGINSSLNFQQTFLEAMKCHFLKDSQCSEAQISPFRCEIEERRKDTKAHSSPRIIFNQVLENPWSPRKPNNFRPFRRKNENSEVENPRAEKIVVNDSNNNIQTTTETVAVRNASDRVSFEAIEPTECNSSSMPTIINSESFKCTHCDQVFTSSQSLAVHMRRHSTNARYTCGECGKTFSQLRNFKYHMSIHRGTREFAATCTVCGKYFNDRGYLSSHMKIHRNRKEYKCTLCPKSFNQRVAYNMHVRIHTGVKPHVCEECGKAFSRKMLLKQHQRTHSGERPYACPHCDKRFADRSNMTLHLRLHSGVKPFSCSLCPKSFTKKHHLKSHLNFHTGSKPYSCPRCKLAFTQSSNMRTHYKKCSAPDPGSSNDNQSNL